MKLTEPPKLPARLGRMATWQRRTTHLVLLSCAFSGLSWFVLADFFALPLAPLRLWWVSHGVSGLASLVLMGAALSQHVLVTWRAKKNRLLGAIVLGSFLLLTLTTGFLYYGNALTRDFMRWSHILLGLSLIAAVPLHIYVGRQSASRHATRPNAGSIKEISAALMTRAKLG